MHPTDMSRVTLWKSPLDRRPSRRVGWVLGTALMLGVWSGTASASPMMDLQLELIELVEQDDEASATELETRVDDGLPPAALSAMLDACREHPRQDLQPLIKDLAMHRASAIRARALLAWAGLGPSQSVDAIAAAADDADPGIRRLAVALDRLHPSDRADAVVSELLAQDEALAEELQEEELEAPAGDEESDS
ncbi:MAG: hypothetical protein ACE37F_13285 [Nannocystaceae bacterium]|nr:hypothetical protein [bacterium]